MDYKERYLEQVKAAKIRACLNIVSSTLCIAAAILTLKKLRADEE